MPSRLVVVLIDGSQVIGVEVPSHEEVAPLHRGHHPVWESDRFHVDICNMVDDVMVGDSVNDQIFRFKITRDLWPWVLDLINAMDEYDISSGSPMATLNVVVRTSIMSRAMQVLEGDKPVLNVFEPGCISPAEMDEGTTSAVDSMLEEKVFSNPGALVP